MIGERHFALLRDVEFVRYFGVSVIALAADVTLLYWATTQAQTSVLPQYVVAGFSYAVGLAVHYLLAVRYVFAYRRMHARRRLEMMVYVATGGFGVLLSAAIVFLGELFGYPLRVSKLVAVVVTFVAIYLIRKVTLFSRGLPAGKGI